MAKQNGGGIGGAMKAAVFAAALGANSPKSTSAATPTEQSQAAQLYRGQNSAKNTANQAAKGDQNESDRIQLENLEAEVTGDNSPQSSLNANLSIKLKFKAPLDNASAQRMAARKNKQEKFPNQTPSPTHPTDTVTEVQPSDNFKLEEPNLLNDDAQPFQSDEEFFNSVENDTDNPETPTDESSNSASQESSSEEDQSKKSEDEQREQEEQIQVEQQAEDQKNKQIRDAKKQIVKKKQAAQALNQVQQQAAQQQKFMLQFTQATRIKQRLDGKLRKLQAEKIALKFLLYTTKSIKAIVDAIQSATRWLASACISLAWTIILGIIGVILYIAYGLLFIPKTSLWATIQLIEKKLKSIEEDITKTKQNQQKAVSVIQSIQRKSRIGSSQKPPKFNVPQQA